MDLSKIYTQIVTQHSRASHNLHHVENATHKLEGVNPTCGDELVLELRVNSDNIIEDAGFIGHGCAIFMASSSVMIDNIKGKSLEYAQKQVNTFFKMINKEDLSDEDEEFLNDAIVFQGVAVMPSRVKCATLSWHTLEEEIK